MAIFGWRNKRYADDRLIDEEKGFLDHLEELRWHLWRSAVAVLIIGIVLFIYRTEVFTPIFMSPFSKEFPVNDWLCQNLSADFCTDIQVEEIWIYMYEEFMAAFTFCFFGGMIAASPYIFWEMWRFVRPALTDKERRKLRFSVAVISLLFLTGIAFAYFIILPFSIRFFSTFTLVEGVTDKWRFGSVVNFILFLSVGTGVLFQLPVMSFFLTRIGLLSPAFLKKYRRHAIVVLMVLSALVTPPDPLSMLLIFVPLSLLYEIGIIVSRRVYRRMEAEEEA